MGDKATNFAGSKPSSFGFQRARAGSGEYRRKASASDQLALVEQLRDLIDGGDWACANGQTSTLLHICNQLTPALNEEHAARASQIELWLETDLLRATALWSDLARDLNRTLQ